ncbi:MAG TPA: AMP-binding protein [Planctomycetaceae bacterium]|nr:AMP-binding protein [Planctomycetaceae bacterium]
MQRTEGKKMPIEPFDQSGIVRGADGIKRYQGLASSLVTMLRASVEKVPKSEAIIEAGGPRISYGELWDRSARIAGGLRQKGIERGDRVAIRLGNGLDWCLAFFGIQLAGAVAVPVNTRFSESEAQYVIDDSGSQFVFEPGRALLDGSPIVIDDATPQDVAAIFYTSGTTGFPKGAMTTHENFLSNIESCRRVMPLPFDGSVRTLISVPLFHVTGCHSQLLTTWAALGAVVIMPTFDIQTFLRLIGEERINSLVSVPAIYWLALNQPNFAQIDVTGINRVSYGGAPTAPDLVRRIMEAFPHARVGNGFGLTETSSVATFLPHEYSAKRPETVGFAAPVVDLKLDETHYEPGIGELLIRGPNVVKGYWNKPEATAETFTQGWLHSGDLARLDADGFVQIVDRAKDMVNRGGENVYCVEVENALVAYPAVFEVAVLAVPDEMMGEKVGAVIVPKPNARVDVADLVAFAKTRIADFKVPEYVVIRNEALPRNPGGKILKKRLRDEIAWGEPVR